MEGKCENNLSSEHFAKEVGVNGIDNESNGNIDNEEIRGQNLIEIAAHIKILGRYSSQCEGIITVGIASKMMYPQEILTNILHAVSKLKDISVRNEEGCRSTVHKIGDLSLLLDLGD